MYKNFIYRRLRIPRKFQVKIPRAFLRCKDGDLVSGIFFGVQNVYIFETHRFSHPKSRHEQNNVSTYIVTFLFFLRLVYASRIF